MSALTRIFNNQIYNSTIVASQKIAPGTITGSLFSSNITVPGDLLIAGNLFVLGSSSYTVIASTNTYVNDPLITLNNGFSGTNMYDEGLILNRGTSQNQAFIWSEFFKEFRMIGTPETGTTYGNVTASNFANLHIGNLTVDYAVTAGTIQLSDLNLTGNLLAAAGVFNALTVNGNTTVSGSLNVGGNIIGNTASVSGLETTGVVYANSTLISTSTTTGAVIVAGGTGIAGNLNIGTVGAVSGAFHTVKGNITQTSSGGPVYFNTTGNISAAVGVFGAINSTGFINTSGNISTAQLNAGQINTTGNVLATAGTFDSLTVNGNETVTGYLNVTGNILGAAGTLSELSVNGNTSLGQSGAISGSWTTVIGNITQTSAGGPVYFNTTGNVSAAVGVFGAINSTGFINTSGNISAAQLNAGQINTTGNILATVATFNSLTVNGNETVTGYLNVTGNILGAAGTLSELTVNGNETVTGYLNVTGNVLASQGTLNYLDVNGNVDLGLAGAVSGSWVNVIGNITQTSAGGPVYFNTTGNVSAAVGIFGSLNATGFINTSGNISASQLNAGQINTTGNVLATAGVFNGLTVNGNETVTGYLNVTGNILGATGTLSELNVNNTLWANASTATTTQGTGAIIVPNGGVSVSGNANIAGSITSAGTAQFNNSVTIGGITSISNTTNATEATGASGALRISGGASIAKDLWIGGNIYASNIFGVTEQLITVNDPLLYLTASNTFPYTYDIGIFSQFVGPDPITGTGNAYQHTGLVRDASDYTWKFFSNVRSEPTAVMPFDSDTIYDPLLAGNLRLTYTQAATNTTTGALQVAGGAGIAGTVVAGQINSTGNVLGQAGTFNALTVNGNESVTGYLNVTGNVMAAAITGSQINTTGNVSAVTVLAQLVTADDGTFGNVEAGFIGNVGTAYTGASINLSGNILAAAGVLNALTVNGNESVTGYLNVTGNVLAAAISGSQINTTGNVLAQAGVFNGLTVNGDESVTGYLNVTGNVLAATVGASFLTASTVAVGNISAVTIGNSGATLTGTSGTFGAVTSGFIGNTGTTYTGASINLSGNVIASTVLAQLVTADDGTFGNVEAGFIGNTGTTYTGASINLSGNVLGQAGTFNALTVNGNESVTGYLNVTGNVMAAAITGSQINTTGNVLATSVVASFLTASTAAVGNISAVTIGNSGATITGTTGSFSGNVTGGLAQFAAINNTPIGNVTSASGAFTTLSASEGIWANSTTASTSTTTGAIVVAGGIGLAGNIRAGGGAVFNNSQTADPFQVKGVATTSLIYADTAQGAVIIGGSNTAPQLGSTLKVNGTDSLLIPVGTSGQRPSATGNVDVAGMIRYNTTIQNVEFYDGVSWQPTGTTLTVISDRQFAGNVAGGFGNVDGTNTNFTIQSSSTTSGTIVSINGVIQFPILAYSVSGTTLTFVEPPAPTDVIDVRVLATTTTVSALSNGNGLQQFIASDTAAEIWTGVGAATKQLQVNKVGDLQYLTGGKTTYTQSPVNIAANNTPYIIATFSQAEYTTAKFLISAKKDNTNVQSMETLVAADGAGGVSVINYAVVNNGTTMGNVTANVVGSNVQVYWTTTTNIINANVKAMGTYIV